MKLGIRGHLTEIITCVKFLVNRFRGYRVLTPPKLPFPIDLLPCPYNSVALPCDTVIGLAVPLLVIKNVVLSTVGRRRYSVRRRRRWNSSDLLMRLTLVMEWVMLRSSRLRTCLRLLTWWHTSRKRWMSHHTTDMSCNSQYICTVKCIIIQTLNGSVQTLRYNYLHLSLECWISCQTGWLVDAWPDLDWSVER